MTRNISKLENKLEMIIWRVLWKKPNEEYKQTIYSGRGNKGKEIAEKKYTSIARKVGTIELYCGIYQVKCRDAHKI
jgi:hypothetical protein